METAVLNRVRRSGAAWWADSVTEGVEPDLLLSWYQEKYRNVGENKIYGDLLTFTRASVKSAWDENGDIVEAAINEQCKAYNPVTKVLMGFVQEPTLNRLNTVLDLSGAGEGVAVVLGEVYPVSMLYTGSGGAIDADATPIAGLTEALLANGETWLQGYYTAGATATVTFSTTATSPRVFIGGADEKLPYCPLLGSDGSLLTVSADDLSLDNSGEPFVGFSGAEGTWALKAFWKQHTDYSAYILAYDGSTRFIYQSASVAGSISTYDGSSIATNTVAGQVDGVPTVVVMSYLEGGNFDILADGSSEATRALTGNLASLKIDIGHLNGATGFHGVLQELAWYPTKFSLAIRQAFGPLDLSIQGGFSSGFSSGFDL